MSRWLRDNGVPVVLFAIKILTSITTGWDTYLVSHNLLSVVLIDGVFLALWLYVAYGSRGKQDQRNRVYAIVGGGTLYALMLTIGWEASPGPVAIAKRIAGALAYLYDTWDYVTGGLSSLERKLHQARQRRAELSSVYHRSMTHALQVSIRRARKRLQPNVDAAVYQELHSMLPQYIRVRTQTTVNAASVVDGLAVEVPLSGRTVADVPQAIVDGLETVVRRLQPGETFTRQDVEAWTGFGRTYASQIVRYGCDLGTVEKAGHGVYAYSPNGRAIA